MKIKDLVIGVWKYAIGFVDAIAANRWVPVVIGVLKYAIGFGLLAYIIAEFWEPSGTNPGIKGLISQIPLWATP